MIDQTDSDPKPNETGPEEEPDMLSESDIVAEDPALEEAQRKIDELNDRVLRLAAELENTRRRAERDKADAGRYAIAGFARDLIGVADNFERALRAAHGGGEPSVDTIAGLLDGLKMTEKELISVLERHGVRRVAAEREKFDPNLHQAVAQVPHPDIPPGHVVDVAQPGFTIGERVLRAAMVTVSSGPAADGGPEQRLDTTV